MSSDVNTGAHEDPLRRALDGTQAEAAAPTYAIVVALNQAGIPQVLRDQPTWVAWQVMAPEKPGKKPRKVPINPVGSGKADTTDPKTWGSFEAAIDCMRMRTLAGIGFVFTGTGIVGIDLDKCRDPVTAIVDPWAQRIVELLATYTEISPTGMGLHLIARGVLPPEGRKRGNIEMYEVARFFTITGARIEGTPPDIEDRTEQIAALHQEVFGEKAEVPFVASAPTMPTGHTGQTGQTPPSVQLSDEDVLTRASAARNGAKFDRLWSGDKTGYDSQSDADLALCGILAF